MPHLPAATIAKLTHWNPVTNVVALSTDSGSTVLCRSDGQVVWTARGRKQSPAARTIWSPSGQLYATVYEDGGYQILQEINGRHLFTTDSSAQIATVAWSHEVNIEEQSRSNDTNEADELQEIPDITGMLPNVLTNKREGSLLVLGTTYGSIQVHLYGVFSLGDFSITSAPIERILIDEKEVNYSIVSGQTLYRVQAGYMTEHAKVETRNLTLKLARIAALLDELKVNAEKLTNECNILNQARTKFIKSKNMLTGEQIMKDPAVTLVKGLTFGGYREGLDSWMQTEHESGLKKWYKVNSQSYEAMRKLLLEFFIPAVQQMIIIFGDLEGYSESDTDGHSDSFRGLRVLCGALLGHLFLQTADLATETNEFRAFAGVLQTKFSKFLDRSIVLVEGKSHDTQGAFHYVTHYLDQKADCKIVQIASFIGALGVKFQAGSQTSRDNLRQQLAISTSVSLNGEVEDIRQAETGNMVITRSDSGLTLEHIHWPQATKECKPLPGSAARFANNNTIASVSGSTFNLILLNGSTHTMELDFEASSVAANSTYAWALSEDLQQFQIVDLAVLQAT